jgi:hypothetical protein
MPASDAMKRSTFMLAATALVAFYISIEVVYVIRAPRVMDEFVDAFIVRQFESKLAYRDYVPPKTVLGFYLELPPIALVRDGWNAMTAVKIELMLLNAALLIVAAVVPSRRLDPRAVLASLALLVVMTNFLERSAELRVDPLGALFALASLLWLIKRRPLPAGIACTASFLATQKSIYFVAASGLALLALCARDRSRERFNELLIFSAASAAALTTYLALWWIVSPARTVLTSVFFDPGIKTIAFTNAYDIRWRYWSQTLERNPFFYALAIGGMVLASRRWLAREPDEVAGVVTPYALTMLLLSVWHKQPWPYFFAFLAPTLFVINASTLDTLLKRCWPRSYTVAFAAAFAGLGLLLPLSRVPRALRRDNGFQQAMVHAGDQLLSAGDTYLDGTSMLFRHEQPRPRFDWLDAPAIQHLQAIPEHEQAELLADFARRPPKLLIWNYRLAAFPPLLRTYLASQYRPVFGVIFLYAPVAATPEIFLAFDGSYRIEGEDAVIDGASVSRGAIVKLRRGRHAVVAPRPIRISLLPPSGIEVDPRYAAPQDLFRDVYDF